MLTMTYDNDADALYIKLRTGDVASTAEIDGWTLIDVDSSGRALGIEVIHPARVWPLATVLERYEVDGTDRALLEAMFPLLSSGRGRVSFPAPDQDAQATTRQLAAL